MASITWSNRSSCTPRWIHHRLPEFYFAITSTHQDKSLTTAGEVRGRTSPCLGYSRHTTNTVRHTVAVKAWASPYSGRPTEATGRHADLNGIQHLVLRCYFEITSTHQDERLTTAGLRKLDCSPPPCV
jgi:hypothetical protein